MVFTRKDKNVKAWKVSSFREDIQVDTCFINNNSVGESQTEPYFHQGRGHRDSSMLWGRFRDSKARHAAGGN